jgi:hypothetical protein
MRHRNKTRSKPRKREADHPPKAAVQTTLRLPGSLYGRAKELVARERSRSMNEFIVNALAAYVKAKERRTIDDAFAAMKDDDDYQREALSIAEEFLTSDLEAARIADADLVQS